MDQNNTYVITQYRKTDNGYNVNGARLYKGRQMILTLELPTKKGWQSKKPIIANFEFVENITDWATNVLIISDDTANKLIDQYKNLEIRRFTTWHPDEKSQVILALCDYITDPYDRG